MLAPSNGTVTYNSIVINWVPLTAYEDTGRDTIVNYQLYYNDNSGSGMSSIAVLGPASMSYTHTVLPSFPAHTDRSDYFVSYYVVAANGVGYGIISNSLQVQTDTYPRQMDLMAVVGTITPLNILVSWNSLTTSDADTGRTPIIQYTV